MNVIEDIIATPPLTSIHGDGATAVGAIAWLCEVCRAANESSQAHTLAVESLAGLAELCTASHWGVAWRREDQLQVELHGGSHQGTGDSTPAFQMPVGGESLLASAMRSDKPEIAVDLNDDKQVNKALVQRGMQSAAAMQVTDGSSASGVLLLGSDNQKHWTNDELKLLSALGHQVSGIHQRTTMGKELRRQQSLLKSLQSSMETAMIVMTPEGRITEVNQSTLDISGFTQHDLVGRSIWSALLVAEELNHVKQTFARLHKDAAPQRFDCFLLTRTGQRRRVSCSISRLAGDGLGKPAIICTAVDITERCEAIERAARAEAVAQHAREMFAELQQSINTGQERLHRAEASEHLPPGVDLDRRARARREYPYMQRVAPLVGNRMPRPDAFTERKCHDISSRGFAFLAHEKPDFDRVVVSFGTAPHEVHLTAEIRHATPKAGSNPPVYIVGCCYTGRVPLE